MITQKLTHKIKKEQPHLWNLLQLASQDGLILLDEENDSITATNRLLMTYPGLHEIICHIVNEWTENRILNSENTSSLIGLIQGSVKC